MNFIELLAEPYKTYENWQIALEVIGTLFGIVSVFFSIRKNILYYPIGIVSTSIYVVLLYRFGLLGDMLINFYYTVMSIYGWVLWSRHTTDNFHIQASRATKREWKISAMLFCASFLLVLLVYYFKPAIDNGFSMKGIDLGINHLDWANWMDMFTTSIFLIAMWLQAKRRIECWILWTIGNIICIPMMIYKGLVISSFQYFVFSLMAFAGWKEWQKTLKPRENVPIP